MITDRMNAILKLNLPDELAIALDIRAARIKYSTKWQNLSIFGISMTGRSSPQIDEEKYIMAAHKTTGAQNHKITPTLLITF